MEEWVLSMETPAPLTGITGPGGPRALLSTLLCPGAGLPWSRAARSQRVGLVCPDHPKQQASPFPSLRAFSAAIGRTENDTSSCPRCEGESAASPCGPVSPESDTRSQMTSELSPASTSPP